MRPLAWQVRGLAVPVLLLTAAAVASPTSACTTFCLRTEAGPFFGKNYDWHLGQGTLIVNPRGARRVAEHSSGQEPARWTARHGSVTFNQYGREFPMGGINEAGLVVELMWLDGTSYPVPDERPAVGTLQWIQYQLDTAATVGEVLASNAAIRVHGRSPIHYLVADRDGAVATVEFLDGRLVAHTKEELPVTALTNSRYRDSLRFLESLDRAGQPAPPGSGSLTRFARAAQRLRSFEGGDREVAFRHAFDTLKAVSQPGATQWSIVYDLARREVRFRTRGLPQVRRLALDDVDFSCEGTAQVLSLQRNVHGNVKDRLVPYSPEANRALVRSSYAGTDFLAEVPRETLDRIASAPERVTCVDGD